MDADGCLERFVVGYDNSLLEEHRSRGVSVDDFAQAFVNESIDPELHQRVRCVEFLRLAGEPLFWFHADGGPAVVDARLCSAVTVVDPTRMKSGTSAVVGQLTDRARREVAPRVLARGLMLAGAIQTFWHIGAELCLESESDEGDAYVGRYGAEHTYYTNDENVVAYAFEFVLDGAGTILVRRP